MLSPCRHIRPDPDFFFKLNLFVKIEEKGDFIDISPSDQVQVKKHCTQTCQIKSDYY